MRRYISPTSAAILVSLRILQLIQNVDRVRSVSYKYYHNNPIPRRYRWTFNRG